MYRFQFNLAYDFGFTFTSFLAESTYLLPKESPFIYEHMVAPSFYRASMCRYFPRPISAPPLYRPRRCDGWWCRSNIIGMCFSRSLELCSTCFCSNIIHHVNNAHSPALNTICLLPIRHMYVTYYWASTCRQQLQLFCHLPSRNRILPSKPRWDARVVA